MHPIKSSTLSYSYLLDRAWPIILANASVPILGLVDTAVIGNVGTVEDLGAIALSALLFNFVYWSFGFLRMSTTGFVARANGAGDEIEVRAVLGRALFMATVLGALLLVLQLPISTIAFQLFSASETVESTAKVYFSIRIWGAPATLATYALMGLLVGLGLSRQLLLVQLFLNSLNIGLDILFAAGFGWGVAGIALGTVLAEWSTVFFSGFLIWRHLDKRNRDRSPFWQRHSVLNRAALRAMLSANSDIMIRTLLLVFSFAWFTNQSALFGNTILAANYILLQFITFCAFFLDGYAFVVESLIGTAIGARDRVLFDTAVKRSTILAAITALLLASLVYAFGAQGIAVLTDIADVRVTAEEMLGLAAIYIFCSFGAFQLDGIFIGASATQSMRNASILSLAVFMLAWWCFIDRFAVQGLWWSFIIYLCARAVALLMYYGSLRKSIA